MATLTPAGASVALTGSASVTFVSLRPAAAALTASGATPFVHAPILPPPVGPVLPLVLPFIFQAIGLTGYAPLVTVGLAPAGVVFHLVGGTPPIAALVFHLTGSAPSLGREVRPAPATLTLTSGLPIPFTPLVFTLVGAGPSIERGLRPAAASLTLSGAAPRVVAPVFPATCVLVLTGATPFVRVPMLPAGVVFVLTGGVPRIGALGADVSPNTTRIILVVGDVRVAYLDPDSRVLTVPADARALVPV